MKEFVTYEDRLIIKAVEICTLTCLCSTMIIACATPSIALDAIEAPRHQEAAGLQRVAVLPFEGRNGRTYAVELEGVLASIRPKGKPYFTLVERARLDQILEEQKLQGRPIFVESTAAKVGRLIGAQGVYMGAVTADTVKDNNYSAPRQRCSYTDKDGKCIRWSNYTVRCTKRTAHFAFTPKLVDVETRVVVYGNNISGTSETSVCVDSGKPLTDGDVLLDYAKKSAYKKFREDIAPHKVTLKIHLLDNTDGISSEIAEKKLKNGIEFARSRRMDRACELWEQGRALAPNSTSLVYNLGICAEAAGSFDDALALYQEADQLLQKPNKTINTALDRVSKRKAGKSFQNPVNR
jgi:tetratricopeptide (TPR) repeat protein